MLLQRLFPGTPPWLGGLAILLAGCSSATSLPATEPATRQVRITPDEVRYLAFSAEGKTLATVAPSASAKDTVQLWDIVTGAKRGQDTIDGTRPRFVTFSPDGNKLALLEEPGVFDQPPFIIHLWDVTADRQLKRPRILAPEVPYHPNAVYHVAFSPDSNTLVTGTPQEVIYLWDLTTGHVKRRFHGGVAASFAPDGRTLLAVTHDGLLRRFDAATGKLIGREEPGQRHDFIRVTRALFAPDGKRVALGDDRTTLVKDVETNRTLCRLNLATGGVPLSFSADGQTLGVAGDRGTHFFDTNTGTERAWLEGKEGWGEFLGNGKHLACVEDKSIVLRDANAVLAKAERAPRPAQTDPPGVALEAELVARQDTYTLDLEGNTPEDYGTRIHFGECPDPPRVDLLLKLKNTGRAPITLQRYGNDVPTLYLVGDGAVNQPWYPVQTGVDSTGLLAADGTAPEQRGPRTLSPGETLTIHITDLHWGGSAFWLLPGEYVLAGHYGATVAPAPNGARDAGDGFGYVSIRFAPIKVKVLPATKAAPARSREDAPEIRRPPPPGSLFVPQPDDGSDKIQAKLSVPANLDKGIDPNTPLKDALEFLADRYDLTLNIDTKAFQALGKERIGESKVFYPPMVGVRLHGVLHFLLNQVDAGLAIRPIDERIGRKAALWIVPLARPLNLAERLNPADKLHRKWVEDKRITIPAGIPEGMPLQAALERVAELSGLVVLLDAKAFDRAGITNVAQKPVTLAAHADVPMRPVLEAMLKPIGATFVLREDLVLVVPSQRE